jgi:hypothetical protein
LVNYSNPRCRSRAIPTGWDSNFSRGTQSQLLRSSYKEGSRQAERPSGPSEPRHSPDRATPSYYTNALELCKWNLPNGCVSCSVEHRGVFIVSQERFPDLAEAVLQKCMAGRPAMNFGQTDVLRSVPRCRLLANILAKFRSIWPHSGASRPPFGPT